MGMIYIVWHCLGIVLALFGIEWGDDGLQCRAMRARYEVDGHLGP